MHEAREGKACGGYAADGEQPEREQHCGCAGEFGDGGKGCRIHEAAQSINWIGRVKGRIILA